MKTPMSSAAIYIAGILFESFQLCSVLLLYIGKQILGN